MLLFLLLSYLFSRDTQSENGAKNKESFVKHQVEYRENRSIEARTSGTKSDTSEKMRKFQSRYNGLSCIPMARNLIGNRLQG